MKIGDMVEFAYGTTLRSLDIVNDIDSIGVYAGNTDEGLLRVLYAGKVYELQEHFVKPISMQRMAAVKAALDN